MFRFTCLKCGLVVIRRSSKGRKSKYCKPCAKIVASFQVRKNYLTQNRKQYKSVYKEVGANAYAHKKDNS